MRGVPLLLLLFWAAPGFPQAVTQGRTDKGLPWAVVELPGGDVEWVALWLPPEASIPPGWEEGSGAWGRVGTVSAPALAAPASLAPALAGVSAAVAAVFLGPVPRRELASALAALEDVRAHAAPRDPCPFADGAVTAWRRESEGFRWVFPLPPPWDSRFELAAAAAWVLEGRFRRSGFSGPVRVEGRACPTLVFHHQGEEARLKLSLAKARRGELSAAVSPEELSGFFERQRREAHRWAVDPRAVALAAAERVGWGRPLGPLFFPLEPSAKAVETLLEETLGVYAGQAELWERERRPLPFQKQTLANGAVLAFGPTAGDAAVLAVALSGLDAGSARAVVQEVAVAASGAGLPAQTVTVGGMAAVALVGSPEDVVEALEGLVSVLASAGGGSPSPWRSQVREALGLSGRAFGENLSVFLAVPEGGEELAEAAEKFLGAVPAGPVRKLTRLASGLAWQAGDPPAEGVAVAELPATFPGLLVAEALGQRLAAQGVEVELHNPPGGLVLVFGGRGAETMAQQEARLAAAWETARLLTAEDLSRAWQALTRRVLGSAAQAAMRQALGGFLPALGSPAWAAPEEQEVRQVVAGLPAYRQLPRFGRGPGEGSTRPPGRSPQGGVR